MEDGEQTTNSLSGREHCLRVFWRVVIYLHVPGVTSEHIDTVEGIRTQVMHASANGKILSLTIVMDEKWTMSKEVREKLDSLLARTKETTTASATVIGGPGVVGGVLRAFITTVVLMSRATFPTKIFNSSADAVAWILQYAHASWTPGERVDCSRQITSLQRSLGKSMAA